MGKVHEVKKVYCCEYDHYINQNGQNCCKVEYTTDLDVARGYEKFRLASIDEIGENVGLGFDVIDVVETVDGVYGFVEFRYLIEGVEEYFGQYIFLQPNSDWEIRDLAGMISRSKVR